MKKKIIIIIVIVFVLIAGVLIIARPKCQTSNTKWSCDYKFGLGISIYQQKCENQDGEWDCFGGAMHSISHYDFFHNYYCSCYVPSNDAGKECISADECNGNCVVEIEYVKKNCPNFSNNLTEFKCENIKGKCTKYITGMKTGQYQLNNGIITHDPIMIY